MADEIDPRVQLIETVSTGNLSSTLPAKVRLTWDLANAVPRSEVVISTHTPSTAAGFVATRVLRRGHPVWLYQDYPEMFAGRLVESWLIRNALRWHDAAFAVSNHSRMQLEGFIPGRPIGVGEGLSHANLFIPVPFAARPIADRNTILYLGDMRPRKGLYDFLDAAALIHAHNSSVRLWIVSKERCEFTSPVPYEYFYRPTRQKLADMYGRCHVFVSASWWESFGIPPLEAMACAAPVVTTNSGGVLDFAEAEYNCLITPSQDPPALADAILRVLNDPDLAARLSANGPPTAARFDWEVVVDRFEAFLYRLLQAE